MPGLRHVVTLTFRDDTPKERLDAIVEGLRALPDAIEEIAEYEVGLDAGLAEGNATLAIVGDFASVADYEVYRDHPAHVAVINDLIIEYLSGRSAVQHHR